jgi:nucleoprotein TPR
VKSELEAKRLENAKLEARIERLRERAGELETSLNGGRKVQENMQQRIQEYSALNSRHERRVQEVEQELIDTRSEMRRFRVQAENATAEKNLMTSSVERLELDNKTLRSDRSNQMQLITTVNEALASTRRNNEEHAKGLRSERDAYHNNYNELRKRADDAADLSKSAESKLEKEREALREDLVKERKNQHETRVALVKAEGKVTSLEKTNEDLAANRDEYKRMYNSRIAGEVNPGSEKEQLEAAIEENVELKKKVSDAEARVEQFRQIASAAEKQMADIQKNQEQLQKIIDEKGSKHVDEVKLLGDEVAKVGAQLQAEKTNSETRAGELAEAKAKVQSQLVAHEAALSTLRSEVDQAKETQIVAENDAKRYSLEANESMDKYQKEVILHAGDVQALKTAQDQRDEAAKALQTKTSELESVQHELTASQASWTEQKRILEHKAQK